MPVTAAAGDKQSNITSTYHVWGKIRAIQVGKQEDRAGITTIVKMGSFFLFDGDSKAADLISYEASLSTKTQGDSVKGFAIIEETMRLLQMRIKNSK